MSQRASADETFDLYIKNIGGIERSSLSFARGVTVLAGENATNRTSTLQAIMAAVGSTRATLKADADEGRVELQGGGESYTRTLVRENGTVQFGGTPYLEDPTVADLFAFLVRDNEARRAVIEGDDLREILMRPVDTDEIERTIRNVMDRRNEIDKELSHLEDLDERRFELEAREQQLTEELSEMKAALESTYETIAELDTTVEQEREEREEREAKVDEWRRARQELQTFERRIETERESLESLRSERKTLREELDNLDEVSDDRNSAIEREMQKVRGQIQQIDSTVSDLGSVIQFNEEFLDENQSALLRGLADDEGTSGGSVTDQLVNDTDTVVCWTCGTDVGTDRVEATLDRLRTFRNERMTEKGELECRISDLQAEKSELERRRRSNERTRRKLIDVEAEIEDREAKLSDLTDRKAELKAEADALGEAVNALEEDDGSGVLEAHKEASRLEVEVDRLKADLEGVTDELAEINTRLADRDELERQREEITSELSALRTRVEDLQAEAIEAFNTHMDAVLEQLGYQKNLERIWIERTADGNDGRHNGSNARFDLHIVRRTDSGSVYEDTIDHLSESEREVTGLVFALAGYLVHEVYDTVPFMLIDSIESIDSNRIARLTDYLNGYADYLVLALLEEDAARLDEEYPRITSI